MAVRATFDLNDRPATEGLGRIKKAGQEADVVMISLGDTIDKVVSTENIAELKDYESGLKGIQTQSRQTFTSLASDSKTAQYAFVGSITEMDRSVALLRENLDSLGRDTATPNVNLGGVTEALGQVELLEERINKLGRNTATPRINAPSSRGFGVPGIGGGGGTSTNGPLPSGGGVGNHRGGSSGGGLSVPFLGSVPWPLVGGALAATPPLLGGAGALLGSAGGAALGAGALGLTGYGVAGTAAAVSAPTAIVAIKGIKEANKELAAYQKQVILTGPNSKKAREDLELYNISLKSAPRGTQRLLHAKTLLSEEFTAATKPGQADIAAMGTRGLNLGRQLLPTTAPISNEFLGEARVQTNQFANFLSSPGSKGTITNLGAEATNDLSNAEDIAQHVAGTIMNIANASRPFFHEAVVFLDQWTGGWQKSTSNLQNTRKDIGGMVDDLKSWAHLGGAGFDLVEDLLKPASGPGTSMVDNVTEQLHEWDKWIQDNPRKVDEFFTKGVSGTEKIAGSLSEIVTFLFKAGQELGPLLEQGEAFMKLLGSSGLLSVGGLPFLLAAGKGLGAAKTQLGNRILGTTGTATGTSAVGGAPVILGGGGRTAASRGVIAAEGGGLISRGLAPVRSFAGGLRSASRVPVLTSTVGGLTMAEEADAGMIGATRFSAGAAARYAGTSALSGVRGGLSTAGDAVRGFSSTVIPYLAVSGGLGAATFQGSQGGIVGAGERIQAGFSSATLGAIPAPPSQSQNAEKGAKYAAEVAAYQAQRFGTGTTGLRRQLLGNTRKIKSLLAPEEGQGGFGIGNFHVNSVGEFLNNGLIQDFRGQGISPVKKAEAEELQKNREGIQGGLASSAFSEYSGAYATRVGSGQGPAAALGKSVEGIKTQVRTLGPATSKLFSEMTASWAAEISKGKPKLKGAVDEINETIEKRYAAMGQQVQVINGRIVNVSESAWGNVAHLIATETQLAYSEGNKNLTALEKRAFQILKNMGYSPTQSQSLVHEAQTGRPTKSGAAANAEATHHGQATVTQNNLPSGKSATGSRLPMPASGSTQDVLNLGGNQYAAGGELISNQHTERRVDQMLAPYGTSLGREIGREGRAHSNQPRAFALGGRKKEPKSGAWRGIGESGLHQGIIKVASAVLGAFPGLQVTSTTSGGHVPGSLHYAGEAVDVSGDTQTMFQAAEWIKRAGLYKQLTEGIHNPNLSVSDGKFVPDSYYSAVWAEHANHIHLGVAHAVGQLLAGKGGGRGGAVGRGGKPQVHLKGLGSARGGVGGAAVSLGSSMEAAGLSKNLNKLIGAKGGGRGGGVPTSGGPVIAQIGRGLLSHGLNKIGAAGIIGNALQESGWDPGAVGSGGGGLWGFTASPYSLSDLQSYAQGQNRPWDDAGLQTQFLLKFLSGGLKSKLNSASSPGAAAALFMNEWERPAVATENQARREQGARQAFAAGYSTGGRTPGFAGWFAGGGDFHTNGPTLFGAGEAGRERVTIAPAGRGRTGSGHTFKIAVDMRGSKVGSVAEAKELGRHAGQAIADQLADALESSDGVPEKKLTG